MKIIIEDRVYGREEIDEDVLIDLINSPEIQRLKNVSQLGMPEEYYNKKNFSRYEHSLGVLILLRRLGACLEEQIAGLLHDVNHKAFSHVIDWIFGDPTKEDHQDNDFFSFVENSGLPKILERYGFDYRRISNLDNFTLLEKPAPSLCADRIDYSLRELSVDGDVESSKKIFSDLFFVDGQIVFRNQKFAELFCDKYTDLNRNSWSSNDSRMRYVILSDILKKVFESNFLVYDDMVKSEKEILERLEELKDEYISKRLNYLKDGFDLIESDDGVELKTKFRYIDPEVIFDGECKNLSEVSDDYFNFIEKEKETFSSFKKMKIVEKKLKEAENE